MYELMQKLCGVLAPSGREYAITEAIRDMVAPYVDEVKVDVLGNVVGKISGTGENKKKILYLAHMDEVGFMVTYIEGNGYIRFTNMGGPTVSKIERLANVQYLRSFSQEIASFSVLL